MLQPPLPFDVLEFRATLQLRTPRRVLLRHGERHADATRPPPPIATELWQGRWVKSAHPAPSDGQGGHAPHLLDRVPTDAGRLEPRDYLPFLLAVRAIVEAERPVVERREALTVELGHDAWRRFVAKLGGVDDIRDRFFPAFISTLQVRHATLAGLRRRGLLTAERILVASDHELLTISGIGELTVAKCRAQCAQAPDRHAEFVDRVAR